MNSPREQEQVFHPASIPVDRATKQREGRRRSCQLYFYVATVLFALFGATVVFEGGYLVVKFSRVFLFPLKSLAIHHKQIQPNNVTQVHPLITPSSTFDIYATVWEDVTDLLARGGKLPDRDEPWKTMEEVLYKRDANGTLSNFTRTDAVVWAGKAVEGATINSKVHTSIPLRIPVAPLYTNGLGGSSLRATFSVSVPEDQAKAFGTFFNASYMLPDGAPVLPKRSSYADLPTDLNTALIDAGISTSLLELVPSPFYRTDSEGLPAERTIDNRTQILPFFDRHPRNLHFLQASSDQVIQAADGRLPEFRDGEARILIPHFRTRSRIGLVRSKDVFHHDTATRLQFEGRLALIRRCTNLDNAVCERPYWKHAFESLFTFTKPDTSAATVADDDNDVQRASFYGPTLTQVSTPAAPQFLRRIPQHLPTLDRSRELAILRSNASVACTIPDAALDASHEYFEFDWQVHFSSHTLQRVMLAESAYTFLIRPPPAPLGPGQEGTKEIGANSISTINSASNVDRALSGDRLHRKDHPTSVVLGSVAMVIWHLLIDEVLLFWFWYSRKTSTGLWIEAQWMWVTIVVLKYVVEVARPFIAGEEASIVSLFFGSTSLAHLPFVAITLMHLKRPANYTGFWSNPLAFRRRRLTRREVKSINMAESVNKQPFYMFFTALFLFYLVSKHSIFVLNPAERCMVDDAGGKAAFPLSRRIFEDGTDALASALLQTQVLAQVYFNYRSSTFTGCFRISAIGTAVVTTFVMIAVSIESLGSWADQRHTEPVYVSAFLELAVLLLLAYQAVVYKGVPQVEGEDEDEE
ncbi:hypothetical protein sr00093 [Sporisorium reilianum SRZ2]|uniref:Uncharacterized protein n=1 Tax=Sporisorium reilianum (strain SRZ2) TaxID=999809 RepID=E6ZPG2_SPORE|nr:hypothetical protein sr00093 [Sporisorium reilianum SRZ2]